MKFAAFGLAVFFASVAYANCPNTTDKHCAHLVRAAIGAKPVVTRAPQPRPSVQPSGGRVTSHSGHVAGSTVKPAPCHATVCAGVLQ